LVWLRENVLRNNVVSVFKKKCIPECFEEENEPKVVSIGPTRMWSTGSLRLVVPQKLCQTGVVQQALIRSSNEFSVKL